MHNRKKSRKPNQSYDSHLASHVELEAKRVKNVTEAILYDLLPSALTAASEGAAAEPSWECSEHVAGAILVTACLLNVPPSFLEFLLCLPWDQLGELSPRPDVELFEAPQVTLDADERKFLVNLSLDPSLVDCVMDFLYRPCPEQTYHFMSSLPVQLRLVSDLPQVNLEQVQVRPTSRNAVAALLDGATPLHAAALRGNPAQIDHLLFCKADPMARTAAGDSPLELVPACEAQPSGADKPAQACQCLGRREAEVWQCRSKLARGLIIRRCFTSFAAGFKAWFFMALLSLACLFGVWSPGPTTHRPVIQSHEASRAHDRRAELSALAASLAASARSEASKGAQHLATAKQQSPSPASSAAHSASRRSPPPHASDSRPSGRASDTQISSQPVSSQAGSSYLCKRSRAVQSADSAFDCFARALKALQENLQAVQKFFDPLLGPVPSDLSSNSFPEEEQADIYACWAEAALFKYRGCKCAGCKATSIQAIRLTYFHTSRLFSVTERKRIRGNTYKLVGASLARVLHTHICLLLQSHTKHSMQHSAVLQAQLCLQEWDRMVAIGLAASAGLEFSREVAALHSWVQTATADLRLAEALSGSPLGQDEPLMSRLPGSCVFDASGQAFLARLVDRDTAQGLQAAVQAAKHASPFLLNIARKAAANAVEEVQCTAALQDIMAGRSEAGLQPSVDELSRAIAAASRFPNLKEDVLYGQQLRARWEKRNEIVQRLERVVEEVCSPVSLQPQHHEPAQADYEEYSADWTLRGKELEQAIEQARETELSISMQKAKKVLKELQSQAAAADAAASLGALLQMKPWRPAELRAEVSRAEGAASAACATLLLDVPDLLAPLVQRAKTELHLHSVTEALHRTNAAAHTTAELPKLESAIQAARKAGLEELLPEPCRRARELRSMLSHAHEAKAALQAALEGLQKHGQAEDADAVEDAIQAGEAAGDLLDADVAHAKQAVARWRFSAAAEAKLGRALSEGTSAQLLSRAIQEANALGLKVTEARKVLKLLQALEAALQQEEPADPLVAYDQLKAKAEAAEQGHVPGSSLAPAKMRLHRLLMLHVRQSLEAALKPKAGLPAATRAGHIQAALDRAEGLIQQSMGTEAAAFLAQAKEGRAASQGPEGGAPVEILFAEEAVAGAAAAAKHALAEGYRYLELEAEEVRRLDAQRVAEQKAKQEQQILERAQHEKLVKERAERERAEAHLQDKERQKRSQQERTAAELKQQMFKVQRAEEDNSHNSRHQEKPGSPWSQPQPRPQQQQSDPQTSPLLERTADLKQHADTQLQRLEPQLQQPNSAQQYTSPQLQQQSPLPEQQSPLPQQRSPPPQQRSSQLQPPAHLQQLFTHSQLQQPGIQLHAPSPQLQGSPRQQQPMPSSQAAHLHPVLHHTHARLQHQAPFQENGWSQAEPGFAQASGLDSRSIAHCWAHSSAAAAERQMPHQYQSLHSMAQDPSAWQGCLWPQDLLSPSSPAEDACNMAQSESHSDSASNNAPRLASRFVARSTSLRSSTASSDGMSSPGNARRSHAGASSVHSFNGAPAHEAYDGLAPAFEAGQANSSHSFFSNPEYGAGPDVPPRTLSPEAGTERSGSSFSSSITGRLTFSDLGGATWGIAPDAGKRPNFAPAVSAFGPVGPKQPIDNTGISHLWAAQPESPRVNPALQSHRPVSHRRDISLSDLGHLGFVPRQDQSASPEYVQTKLPVQEQSVAASSVDVGAPRTIQVQRPCRFFSKGHCRYGDACKFSHGSPSASLPTTPPSTSATGVALEHSSQQYNDLPAIAASELKAADVSIAGNMGSGSWRTGQHGLPQAQQLQLPSGPFFEFKPSHVASGLQTAFVPAVSSPSPRQSNDGKTWSATDIANSSPFPGVGNGLPKKFVP